MNPLHYWIFKDTNLRIYLDKYQKEMSYSMAGVIPKSILKDIKFLYENGNAWEKSMALTVLSASNIYFANVDK